MSVTENRPAAGAASRSRILAVVGLLVLFELVSGVIQGSISPLIPAIAQRLDITAGTANWITAVQFLAAAVSVPLFGRLGDLHGHRRMLRVALASIATGSVIVALAPDLTTLLVGRALLGPLAALLPLEVGLIRDRLSTEQGRRSIGILVGALTLGSAVGSSLLGAVHNVVGDVRISLWVVAAAAIGCVALSFAGVPESRRRAAGRMDWVGAGLLSVSLVVVLLALSQGNAWGWLSPVTLGALLCGLALLAVWVRVELGRDGALVDVRAVAQRAVAPHYVSGFVLGFALLGGQSVLSTFLSADPGAAGYGFGLDALWIGLVITVMTVLAFVGSSVTSGVAGRLGYRATLVAAFVMVAAGHAGMALLHGSLPLFVAGVGVSGLGFGLGLGALPTVIVENSSADRSGSATAVYNNLKTLGGSVAGAVFAALLGAITMGGGPPALGGYVAVWLLTAALALGSALLTLTAPRHD